MNTTDEDITRRLIEALTWIDERDNQAKASKLVTEAQTRGLRVPQLSWMPGLPPALGVRVALLARGES